MTSSNSGVQAASNATFIGSALWIILSVALFTGSHGFVRGVGKSIHPYEIAFFTSLFSFAFYLPWLLRTKFRPMRTTKIRTHIVRAFFNAGAVGAWYTALSLTPLADATALALTSPLIVTLGAVLFLGEKARLRRWIALGVGLSGALIIIRPGFQSFSIGFVFVILSIILGSGSRIFAKHLLQWDQPPTIGAWVALLQIPITFCMAIYFWRWPDLIQLTMLAAVGLFVGGAHLTMTLAYKRSEVSALEPFNFIRLIIATLIGFFIFSELPDIWTWIGGGIIIASTSYIARREAIKGAVQTTPNE
ncbi:MAG: DMT family transporter [Rhodospirillaceae bacterium]|jgi:drug/metabolite transporter (DMT)-like permease|nr:DMT family transporter [Rhodospirillaceae bacterium]MBT4588034.1 DMT family transporter [Rhodospirillaceae bacterium]MBT4940715.1 DMT family transporter [Rhodospirillaceae bacterium]MBT5941080.1 DMT family transporter [Rhodospirillaceae bacterium]MBT7268847.1 DMT family transporter [Rhodospirillaceae bacterium]